MKNVASIEIPLTGGQNGHKVLVLTDNQYALASPSPFIRTINPSQMPNILAWIPPVEENCLLWEHKETRSRYDLSFFLLVRPP